MTAVEMNLCFMDLWKITLYSVNIFVMEMILYTFKIYHVIYIAIVKPLIVKNSFVD